MSPITHPFLSAKERSSLTRRLLPLGIHTQRRYVKAYVLPDRSKSGKRKTKVKKHSLDPVFDEVLKFSLTVGEIEGRTLWLTVWHSDRFGRNDFLGEVTLPLGHDVFENSGLKWYPLQDKVLIRSLLCLSSHSLDHLIPLSPSPSPSLSRWLLVSGRWMTWKSQGRAACVERCSWR